MIMNFDDTDRRILNALQKSGRMSNAELAEKINLSASACHRRVQRLEAEGIIRDYVALLDPRTVDRRTTVFVEISLNAQADETLAAFEREGAGVRLIGFQTPHGLAGDSRGTRHFPEWPDAAAWRLVFSILSGRGNLG